MSDNYVWSLELSNPGWKFARGASFNVSLHLGKQYLSQPADAISDKSVRVLLRNSLETFQTFNRIWNFELTAGAVNSRFSLAFGDQILSDIVRCVSKHDSVYRLIGNEINLNFGAAPWQASGQSFDSEAAKLSTEITKYLALKTAPLANAAAVVARLKPNSSARIDRYLLMIDVVPAQSASDPEVLAKIAVARDVKACRGSVFAGVAPQATPIGTGARGYSSCRMPTSAISMRYGVLPRKDGGYYLTSVAFGGPELVDAVELNASLLDQDVWSALPLILAR